MNYILLGHNCVYDIQSISQIFFPNERFTKLEKPSETGFTVVSSLQEDRCIGELFLDGSLVAARNMLVPQNKADSSAQKNYTPVVENTLASETPLAQEIRRRLMITLYLACQDYTSFCPPWGALTGIRPSKMCRLLLDKGLSEDEIVDACSNNYFARTDKIKLALEISRYENRVLAKQPENAVCVYIGIPFCPSRCLYCSFASNAGTQKADAYLTALKQELTTMASLICEPISAVYIGGGTPTALSAKQLESLLSLTVSLFAGNFEFSVEAGRPDTIDLEKLQVMKAFGVTRISLNPQTMNDETLIRIGRGHTSADFYKSYALARTAGFDNINTDIILGLPGETAADVKNTLDSVIELNPENITVHILTVKRASKLAETLEKYPLASAAELAQMIEISSEYCKDGGLVPYYMYRQKNMLGNFENVGYCRPGKECVYNICIMEETETVWAAGAGAVSKIIMGSRLQRVFNVKNLDEYITRIDEMINRKVEFHANSARN
jgi:oxygen-independent coproporphyrinogen-3 oxidase